MRRKAFSENSPEWEKSYLNKPELPDWRDSVAFAGIEEESKENEFEALFQEKTAVTSSALDRKDVTDRASFGKKDYVKISAEINSRLDRFLKGYKWSTVEAKQLDNNINYTVKLTRKGNNPKTIVTTFAFTIEKPAFLSPITATSEKIKASSTFQCNEEIFPLNKSGFDTAFDKYGFEYSDSHVIMTMHQIEEKYAEEDILEGIESGSLLPLSEQIYVCHAGFLNRLTTNKKVVAIDNSYVTERQIEQDSDSSQRLQSVEKEVFEFNSTPDKEFRYYSETNLYSEIKNDLGLLSEDAHQLVKQAVEKNLLISVPGGFISESKFSQLALSAGLCESTEKVLDKLAPSHIDSKIPGSYRLEPEATTNDNNLLIKAKSKIDGKNQILGQEITKSEKQIVVKIPTIRKIASNEVNVDYFFCFKSDGSFKNGHIRIAGKNIDLEKAEFFYSMLEKEYKRSEASEKAHTDHAQHVKPLDRDNSLTADDSRVIESKLDVEKFVNVQESLTEMITQAKEDNLLTEADKDIFFKKVAEAKQISDLTLIEKEFKILTDIGDL